MAWVKIPQPCPKCGNTLYKDTATGEVCCESCDYSK